jgi:hypothetical protein
VLVERRGGRALVSEQPIGADGVADVAQETVRVAEAQRQAGAREQRLDAQWRLFGRRGQSRLQPAVALREEPTIQPEPPQPRRQPQRRLGIAAQGPGETGAQVVVLALEHVQRAPRAGGERVVLLGEREAPIEVAQRDGVALGGRLEPLGGVLAHGVEQAEALILRDDERLLDQPGKQIDDPPPCDSTAGADLLGRLEREASGEEREPAEKRALLAREQVMTPVDRGPQRLLAG